MFGLKTFVLSLILLVAALVGLAVSLDLAQHWWAVHTGTDIPGTTNIWYNFWSGFGSDLGELTLVTAVVASAGGAYRKINCHDPKCWRLWHHEYEIEGVKYRLCRKHHPGVDHKNRLTADHFADHYAKNQ